MDVDVRKRQWGEQGVGLCDLEALGERVRADHDQFDLYLAALFECRFRLTDIGLEGPAKDVYFEDT